MHHSSEVSEHWRCKKILCASHRSFSVHPNMSTLIRAQQQLTLGTHSNRKAHISFPCTAQIKGCMEPRIYLFTVMRRSPRSSPNNSSKWPAEIAKGKKTEELEFELEVSSVYAIRSTGTMTETNRRPPSPTRKLVPFQGKSIMHFTKNVAWIP